MCGRLVNLDTVARVIADYYHLKTDTQLAALNEALSRVPAETVGGGHGKDHVDDSNKMVGDLVSRQAAIDTLAEWHDPAITNRLNNLPSAQQWIPWDSEKLPEESGQYIVTAYDGNISRVTFAKYQKRLKRWELTGARAYWRVLAWCPLPEPWKGEQE